MTPNHIPSLEQALVKIINAELDVMQSLCEQQFPCDLSTTIAMRMSRSIVSAICSTAEVGTDQDQIVSSATREIMQQANFQLAHLSDLFEKRLERLTNNNAEWKAWTV